MQLGIDDDLGFWFLSLYESANYLGYIYCLIQTVLFINPSTSLLFNITV